jgi:hypothetical protein
MIIAHTILALSPLLIFAPLPSPAGASSAPHLQETNNYNLSVTNTSLPGQIPALLLKTDSGKVIAHFRNLDSFIAGDSFLVIINDSPPKELTSNLLLETVAPNNLLAYVHRPGPFVIRYDGVDFSVYAGKPTFTPPEELIGFCEYSLLYTPAEYGLYSFIDRLAEAGFNHTRIVLSARAWSWEQTNVPSPFISANGKFDISSLDQPFLLRLRTWLYYALQRGIIVHVDIFDEVALHHPEYWTRSEWAAQNNVNGWLQTNGDSPQAFYDTVMQEDGPNQPLQIQQNFFNTIARFVPKPHIIGEGNELASIEFAHHFLLSYDGSNQLCCGLQQILDYDSYAGSNGADPQKLILLDEIFSKVSYISVHGIQPDNIEERYGKIQTLLRKHPHIKVIFSTDGAGLGSDLRRPHGPRPNSEDIRIVVERARALAGRRCAGVEVKILNYRDFVETVQSLAGVLSPKTRSSSTPEQ